MSDTINSAVVGKMASRLMNRAWRINHLYLIRDEQKRIIPFSPRAEQRRFYQLRHDRNFVPKARKYGISTCIVLDYLDACIWANSQQAQHCAHVDFREDDAKEKLEIARFAWTEGVNHPDEGVRSVWIALHERNPLISDNKGELKWLNGSKQQASTSFMGGNPTRLHISEYGPLSAQFPDRAAKVARGTINAVPAGGIVDIETTMEGGTFGECANIFALAEKMQGKKLTALDWKLFFIPWYLHPSYVLEGEVPHNQETKDYFGKIILPAGQKITLSQQAWYEKKKDEQHSKMYTQYPTVVGECWYAGTGTALFNADALVWQKEQIIPLALDIRYGDIVVQGDMKAERSANWIKRDKAVAPFRILEHPMPGRRYLIFADACVGKRAVGSDDGKRDAHSYGVIRDTYIDPESGQKFLAQIVCMCQGDDPQDPLDNSADRSPTPEFIRRVVALHVYYGNCMVVPETNNMADLAERMIEAGVRTMYKQGTRGTDGAIPGENRTTEVWGWWTDEGTRRLLCDCIEEQTRQQSWICSFLDVLHQMTTFVRNKKGRAEAAPGEHDDNVIGPAIGLYALPHATKYVGREEVIVQRYVNDYRELHHDPRGL